jgi:hypothetical protein
MQESTAFLRSKDGLISGAVATSNPPIDPHDSAMSLIYK